jgi:regulator of replication initiation timing
VREFGLAESARAKDLETRLEAAEETAEELALTAQEAAETQSKTLTAMTDEVARLRADLAAAHAAGQLVSEEYEGERRLTKRISAERKRLAEENAALDAALLSAKQETSSLNTLLDEVNRSKQAAFESVLDESKKLAEENKKLQEELRRAKEEEEVAKRAREAATQDGEKLAGIAESLEQKLREVGEKLTAADLGSQLCTQSTTLATRVATALEERAKLLDHNERSAARDKFWDKFGWVEKAKQIEDSNAQLEELKKREGSLIRKNAQLLLLTSQLEKENSELRGRLAGYETELDKRDAVVIQQYSIADTDEVDFPSPSSSASATEVAMRPTDDANPVDPDATLMDASGSQPKASLTRRRVRFADEAVGSESDPSAKSDASADSDRFYEWLMVDNYLEQEAQ